MEFGDANNGQHGFTIDQEHTREVVKKHFKSVFLSKYDDLLCSKIKSEVTSKEVLLDC